MLASKIFEPEPDQVSAARCFVSRVLRCCDATHSDVSMMVSELATNAVLHARSEFEVSVAVANERIRVEVSDHNSRLPTMVIVSPDAYSGRGLMLVQALSDAWGIEAQPNHGKSIWFEVLNQAG